KCSSVSFGPSPTTSADVAPRTGWAASEVAGSASESPTKPSTERYRGGRSMGESSCGAEGGKGGNEEPSRILVERRSRLEQVEHPWGCGGSAYYARGFS